jgi:hypothetical protein
VDAGGVYALQGRALALLQEQKGRRSQESAETSEQPVSQ